MNRAQVPDDDGLAATVELTTVKTEFGELTVDVNLKRVWDQYGWPTQSAVEKMVNEQKEHRNG